jgi:hypothetical protein
MDVRFEFHVHFWPPNKEAYRIFLFRKEMTDAECRCEYVEETGPDIRYLKPACY